MWALRFATATVIAFVFVWTNIAAAEDADWHGITFETLTADTAAKNGLTLPFGALITEVNKQSPAHGKLTPGDAIIAAGGQAIINADALSSTLNAVAGGGSLTLVRNRQGTAPTQITIARAAAPRPKLKVVATLPTLMLDTGGHMTLIRDIVYTPDGKQLVSAGDDKVIRVWDVATRRTVRTMRGNVEPGDPGKIFSMAMSPDGKWLAVGGWLKEGSDTGQHIRMYDFATGEIRALLRGHTNVILGLHFSRDGSLLMSGGSDDIGILWRAPKQGTSVDWSRGQLVHKFKGHKDRINAVAILPGNRRGVTGADDDTAILWDLTTGAKIATMGGHTDHIYSLDVARDGTVATGDDGGGIHIWSLAQLNRATGGTITAERTWKQRAGIGQVAFSRLFRDLCGWAVFRSCAAPTRCCGIG